MDLLSKLVHSNVGGGADKHRTIILFHQVVNNGSRRNGLPSSWRSLSNKFKGVKHTHTHKVLK